VPGVCNPGHGPGSDYKQSGPGHLGAAHVPGSGPRTRERPTVRKLRPTAHGLARVPRSKLRSCASYGHRPGRYQGAAHVPGQRPTGHDTARNGPGITGHGPRDRFATLQRIRRRDVVQWPRGHAWRGLAPYDTRRPYTSGRLTNKHGQGGRVLGVKKPATRAGSRAAAAALRRRARPPRVPTPRGPLLAAPRREISGRRPIQTRRTLAGCYWTGRAHGPRARSRR